MFALLSSIKNYPVTVDLLLGSSIMGTTGGVIGYYLDSPVVMFLGALLGIVLGCFMSLFHARLFFISVLSGTVLAGGLALLVGGPELLVIGAGSGGAIGGFVGVNLKLFSKE